MRKILKQVQLQMDFIVIMGPQAVGKMTVGREVEKRLDAKLLFNHQTIDLFAHFLGYTKETFRLSDQTRKELFRAFVNGEENTANGIIFTLVVAFDLLSDKEYLKKICTIFTEKGGRVFLVELETSLEIRLERNGSESRLEAKPSKRNLAFSKQELLTSSEKHRLNSSPGEVNEFIPEAHYLRIDNSNRTAGQVAEEITAFIQQTEVEL